MASAAALAGTITVLYAGTFAHAGQTIARLALSEETSVFGYLWDADNTPIANAPVQLRNVTTGRVHATAVTAVDGSFAFEQVEPGTYVVEHADTRTRALAVGHVFSISSGETVATFIRLGTRSSWLAALFRTSGHAAALAIGTAASLGVTAVAPPPRPVSPNS